MEEKKQNALNDFFSRFKKLGTGTKVIIIGGVTLCAVAIGVGFLYSNKGQYTVLFSNLSASDAAEVTTKLDELKTKYQVKESKDGTINIMVPEKDSANARMEVSATFEPSDGVIGYEILDTTSFGETQSDRDQKKIRALEGEITKTLQKLPFIEWARVHINVASNSFLETNNEESTASITLQLADDTTLNKKQTMGIIRMVSNSVKGLKANNVQVIDNYANLLSDGLFTDDSYTSTDDELAVEKEKERVVKEKVQNLLNTVVGKGNSVVEVDLSLNFDKKEIAEQILGDKVAVSEKEITKDTNISSGTQEVPGADSNADQEDYIANSTAGLNNNSENYSETQTNYEIEKRNEKTVVATGAINKMTLSVVLNEDALADENGNVDEALKTQLIDNVKNAAGFDEDRKDSISLTVTKFNKDLENEASAIMKSENTRALISKGIIGVVALAVLGVLIFLIKKATDSIKSSVSNNTEVPEELKLEQVNDMPDIDGIISQEESMLIEQRINKTIDSNTEDAVKAIRFMLNSNE